MEILSSSPATTKKLAALLAKEISKYKGKGALVIGLTGNLGSGKTTFIQGFARGLGISRRLLSPTFLIIRNYKLKAKNWKLLYHIDCYRLKKPQELVALDFKKITADPKNIVIVEWAEKTRRLLPKKMVWIKMGHGKRANERTIKVKAI
ncbi:MAG: tRNA (adenosine(37)-N6)-threonylcarbamoyltransferase complex ATPase subunit type 1 TsaE [Candidatus Brennerbacteria bacterium]|nr:tRNA (adenosine(37)-N6)-threonylcarbamoyltransferase complex ATPase subunit type 1 TsaE [Candidatus Brennerbacteria bacterium]